MHIRVRAVLICGFVLFQFQSSPAQLPGREAQPYEYQRSIGISAEYANDSSHILLGAVGNRRLAGIGADYSRRLLKSRYVDWSWVVEAQPMLLEEDPMEKQDVVYTSGQSNEHDYLPSLSNANCLTITVHFDYVDSSTLIPYDGTTTLTCSTRWTYTGGINPLGQRLNFAPRHRVQPYLVGNGGFLASTNDVPVAGSSFNFSLELGGGVEWYTSAKRSWSVEAHYHHMSPVNFREYNYGLDTVVYKATYRFGH